MSDFYVIAASISAVFLFVSNYPAIRQVVIRYFIRRAIRNGGRLLKR